MKETLKRIPKVWSTLCTDRDTGKYYPTGDTCRLLTDRSDCEECLYSSDGTCLLSQRRSPEFFEEIRKHYIELFI